MYAQHRSTVDVIQRDTNNGDRSTRRGLVLTSKKFHKSAGFSSRFEGGSFPRFLDSSSRKSFIEITSTSSSKASI